MRDLVTTENLSNQSFSSIPYDGSPELPGRRDAEPPHRERVGKNKDGRVPAMDSGAPLVDLLELGAPTDAFDGAKQLGFQLSAVSCQLRSSCLLVADGQPFSTLRTAPFQHQSAVFCAHPHEKSVCPLAAACIRLKRANSLSHSFLARKRTVHVSERLRRVSIGCSVIQRHECATVGVLLGPEPAQSGSH